MDLPYTSKVTAQQSVWWPCLRDDSHQWRTSISNRRVVGTGRPRCGKKGVSRREQEVFTALRKHLPTLVSPGIVARNASPQGSGRRQPRSWRVDRLLPGSHRSASPCEGRDFGRAVIRCTHRTQRHRHRGEQRRRVPAGPLEQVDRSVPWPTGDGHVWLPFQVAGAGQIDYPSATFRTASPPRRPAPFGSIDAGSDRPLPRRWARRPGSTAEAETRSAPGPRLEEASGLPPPVEP